ncbi:hypothetical protein ILYODFUR_030217 [Ilyodon furcidens]|uniref:Secreted protein n=1 Tax=Ilyodon furcidens TaxID=33524 RepID=A0ABV0UK98_9TELE
MMHALAVVFFFSNVYIKCCGPLNVGFLSNQQEKAEETENARKHCIPFLPIKRPGFKQPREPSLCLTALFSSFYHTLNKTQKCKLKEGRTAEKLCNSTPYANNETYSVKKVRK